MMVPELEGNWLEKSRRCGAGVAFPKGRGLCGWLETAPCPGMQCQRCPEGTGCSGPELGMAKHQDESVFTPPHLQFWQ